MATSRSSLRAKRRDRARANVRRSAAERDGTAIWGGHGALRPAERFPGGRTRFASGSASFKRELAARADGLVVLLVGLDDALHQGVAHHVLVVELDEADAFDALQDFDRIDQAAAARVRADRSA